MMRLTLAFAASVLTACAPNVGTVDEVTSPEGVAPAADDGFVDVAASTFQMGCTSGQTACAPDETLHSVTLTHDYRVGETEVTQAEFEVLMGYNPSTFADCDGAGPEDCPVESVTWHEAAAYANALARDAELPECYTCSGEGSDVQCESAASPYSCEGYRLLTEAELEGAARCGTDLRYAGSDESNDVAWTSENSGASTHGIAGLAPNACGIYDMSGNVWEWAQDWYADYGSGDATDPAGALAGDFRVLRGGTWVHGADNARVSFRRSEVAGETDSSMGFRVGRSMA